MTAQEFRRMALRLPQSVESAHVGHPDFRVGGRVFATLGYPSRAWAMVRLPPEHQEFFVRTQPGSFVPVKGAWGRGGATNVKLRHANTAAVAEALNVAWEHAAPRKLLARTR